MSQAAVNRKLTSRIDEIDRRAKRFKLGKITAVSPLTVSLGGGAPIANVKAVNGTGTFAVDDTVAVDVFGSDLLIIGKIGTGALSATDYTTALQPGVLAGADCALTSTSGSAVSIAAGSVFVTSGGTLVRTTAALTALTGIPAASASNFRLDQVVVDATGTISRLAGTQGTGVTIDNRTGAAALTGTQQLLHDLLVTSAGLLAANCRDRRPWARGAFWNTTIASGGIYSTTSTAVVAIDATNLSARIECSGGPVEVSLNGKWGISVAGGYIINFDVLLDGAAMGLVRSYHEHTANYYNPVPVEWRFTPAAGSHLIVPVWYVTPNNAATIFIDKAVNAPFQMHVEERIVQNANNGTT